MRITLKSLLQEIDWKLPDVADIAPDSPEKKTRCMSISAVKDWMNSEFDRLKSGGKLSRNMPMLTPNTVRGLIVTDENGKREVNIKEFIEILTTPPETIFDFGEKAMHTRDENTITINTGIPALRGIVWDKDSQDFKIINTCPSAGKCVVDCYALQGLYYINDGKNLKLARRLQIMLEDPKEYIFQAFYEAKKYATTAKKENKVLEIRWNDAGDFYSERYFQCALQITRQLLEAGYPVKSYFYTKVGKYVELGEKVGMEVTFSLGGTDDLKDAKKKSVIVPRDLFISFVKVTKGRGFVQDPVTKKTKITPEAKEELRKKIFDEYKDDPNFKDLSMDTLKYTDELPNIVGDEKKYSCIILPKGDSDRPAQREDVKHVFLLKH